MKKSTGGITRISALLVVAGVTFVTAQGIDLTGTVSNESGNPVAGAQVKLVAAGKTATTDANGKYWLSVPVSLGRETSFPNAEPKISGREMSFSLPSEEIVSAEFFNLKGESNSGLKPTVMSPGNHTLALSPLEETGLYTLVISIGTKKYSRRVLHSAGNPGGIMAPAESSRDILRPLAKSAATLDTLAVSANGYYTKSVPLSSLTGTMNVTLTSVPVQPPPTTGSGNLRVLTGGKWVSVGCGSGTPRADGSNDKWQIVDTRKLRNQNGVYLYCGEGWADGRNCECDKGKSEAYHAVTQADFNVNDNQRKYGNSLTNTLAARGPMWIFPNNAHEFCLAVGSNNNIQNKDGGDDGSHNESTHKGKCNEWCLDGGCPK